MEVLNLKKSVVNLFWEQRNKEFAALFKLIEDAEYWCVDDSRDVAEALNNLARLLSDGSVTAEAILENSENLFLVLAYIKMPKAMRLLMWFDEKYAKENLSQELVKEAIAKKDETFYRLLLERLMLIKDFSLLNQIYSQDRFNKVKNLLNKFKQGEK